MINGGISFIIIVCVISIPTGVTLLHVHKYIRLPLKIVI